MDKEISSELKEPLLEVFRPIIGYEKYCVGSFGTVVRGSKTLKTFVNKEGYVLVSLCKDGICKSFFVHRLVAIAFIENPNNLPQINHKDENKANNCVENLEWCDQKYNNMYGTRIERISRPIYQIDSKTLEIIKRWDGAAQIQDELGINNETVRGWCVKHMQGRKYIWIYVDEYERYKDGLIKAQTDCTGSLLNKICTRCNKEFPVKPHTKRNVCWDCYMDLLKQKEIERLKRRKNNM